MTLNSVEGEGPTRWYPGGGTDSLAIVSVPLTVILEALKGLCHGCPVDIFNMIANNES